MAARPYAKLESNLRALSLRMGIELVQFHTRAATAIAHGEKLGKNAADALRSAAKLLLCMGFFRAANALLLPTA
jgi:hypothetical protein